MTLPEPPITIDGDAVTRRKITFKPGAKIRVGKEVGTYRKLITDRRGGVYMQVVLDGRSHYLACSKVLPA